MLGQAFLILATWGAILLVLLGCGQIVMSILGPTPGDHGLVAPVWLGFGLWIALLQLFHIFVPVREGATIIVGCVGLAGLAQRLRLGMIRRPHGWSWEYGWAAVALGFGLWLANRAMAPVGPFDAGLYHLSALRWMAEYPIVPGLGNLHSRLAFNNSYFLFLASLSVGPWRGIAHAIGPGFLLWLAGSHSLFHLARVLVSRGRGSAQDLFLGAFIIPIVRLGFQFGSSPSPDLAVFVLGYALAWLLLQLHNHRHDEPARPRDLFQLLFLCAIGITVKLSLAPLAVTAAILAVRNATPWIRDLRRSTGTCRQARWLIGLLIFVLGIWGARGFFLSGYPTYPLAVGGIGLPWAMPVERVQDNARWVASWARMPRADPQQVLGSWSWFQPWLRGVLRIENRRFDVALPLLLTVVGLGLRALPGYRPSPIAIVPGSIFLPAAVSAVFWFLSAPDPRLSGAGLWWLAAAGISIAFAAQAGRVQWGGRAAGAMLLAILLISHWRYEKFVDPGSPPGFPPIPEIELTTFRTDSGLALFVPRQGNLCWDAPLPCTPEPDRRLALRAPGDLGSGFLVAESTHRGER